MMRRTAALALATLAAGTLGQAISELPVPPRRGRDPMQAPARVGVDGGMSLAQLDAWASRRRRSRQTHRRKR